VARGDVQFGNHEEGEFLEPTAARILVVEDEAILRRLLRRILEGQNYEVQEAPDGDKALTPVVQSWPDLVILDLLLPDLSGLEVCRRIRASLMVPILVISARAEEAYKVAALDLGADDYVTKPFTTGELLARVRALLRRVGVAGKRDGVVTSGELRIDLQARRVMRAGFEVRLSRTEFEVLTCLAQNPDSAVASRTIVEKVWGLNQFDDLQSLRVYISRLRNKLESNPLVPQYILTDPGVGYRLRLAPPSLHSLAYPAVGEKLTPDEAPAEEPAASLSDSRER
jgi:two-component system KDP operon response regulator KdpE